METSSAENRGRSSGVSITLWVAALLLFHPLSMGPIAYLGGRGLVTRERAMMFYVPEIWIVEQCQGKWPWLVHWYTRYVESCHKAGLSHGSP